MRKSFIMVIVIGVLLVMTTLSIAAIRIWGAEIFLAEKKIDRLRAIYAGRAALTDIYMHLCADPTWPPPAALAVTGYPTPVAISISPVRGPTDPIGQQNLLQINATVVY